MKSHRFKGKTKSKGEKEVFDLLRKGFPTFIMYANYPYNRLVKTTKNLRADVYIKTLNTVIEYQGEHHFAPVYYGKKEEEVFKAQRAFEERQQLDELKRQLLKEGGVLLIEIPHYKWKKMDKKEKIEYLYDELANKDI